MRASVVSVVFAVSVAAAVACAGEGVMAPNNNGNNPPPGSGFAAQVQPIFTASCAFSGGCHAGTSPAQGMNLSQGQAHASIVNVMANETSSTTMLMRVRPNFPDSSYLVHKLQGTQDQVGGSGGQMPLGAAALSQSQIDVIRQWITDGAPNN
jgi:hypothetical protein